MDTPAQPVGLRHARCMSVQKQGKRAIGPPESARAFVSKSNRIKSVMAKEDFRKRLEALNRGPLPTGKATPAARQDSSRSSESSRTIPRALDQLIQGEEVSAGGATYYRILRPLSAHWPTDPRIGPRFSGALADASNKIAQDDSPLSTCTQAGLDSQLFLDLETCGFNGTPVFLIGCMYWADGELCVEQLLARNYEEEPAILKRFARLAAHRTALITFNGKTFDWPFVRDRAAIWQIDLADPASHCDLLHVSRRRYGKVVPDCKLQTLELYICNRRRTGDIPGSEIPAAYHDFVRTSDARQVRDIVHHNFLDIVTMAELIIEMHR